MRASLLRPVTVGVAFAAITLLSACSGQTTAAPAPQATTTVTSTATTTVTNTVNAKPTGTATTAPKQPKQQQAGDDTVEDVNCSANGAGKVGPAGGKQVDLIAKASNAGRVGCTEAFTVITEYYRDAPAKSEGTSHYLVVRGWKCMADTGAQGSGRIGCDKDGLSFHTGQS